MNVQVSPQAAEKPRNGLEGLKHWRQDMVAGLMVSLVSLPFSLAIAVASGAPPVAGLISAIIAGLIYPFLGGSFVTISGPAAGLAPALLAIILTLGAGNKEVGYPLLLCVVCMVGLVQIVLSLFKAARFSALFPSAVVEGMLCAIGMLIVVKELPYIFGRHFEAHSFFGILLEIPSAIAYIEPKVFFLGAGCLALLFLLGKMQFRLLKAVPAPLIVVLVGVGLGQLLGIDHEYMIEVPHGFTHGFVLPNFEGLLTNHTLWWAAAVGVLTLTMIDGVESLATIAAIDKIDPFKRKSSPNRTLLAMGISNICSSLAGGLTIIPGGVKSTTCIVMGGRTLWANFYNAIFLILYLQLGSQLINMIPLSALAAVVIYIGWKLCEPRVWKHISHIGSEQLLVFSVTVFVTVLEDLLVGIFAGILAKLLVTAWIARKVAKQKAQASGSANGYPGLFRQATRMFRDPVTRRRLEGTTYHLYLDRPLVSFNLLHVQRELAAIPPEANKVYLCLEDGVTLIDHTACEYLLHFSEAYAHSGKGNVKLLGLEKLTVRSKHGSCMRVAVPDGLDAEDELVEAGYNMTGHEVPNAAVHGTTAGQQDCWKDLNHLALRTSEASAGDGGKDLEKKALSSEESSKVDKPSVFD